jgi:hypothetical protein
MVPCSIECIPFAICRTKLLSGQKLYCDKLNSYLVMQNDLTDLPDNIKEAFDIQDQAIGKRLKANCGFKILHKSKSSHDTYHMYYTIELFKELNQ